jgi:hypothetical protein
MTSKKYDIWRQSLTVATVVKVEQLSEYKTTASDGDFGKYFHLPVYQKK